MSAPKRKTVALILSADRGMRARAGAPSMLEPLMGRPLVSYAIDSCRKAGVDRIVAVDHRPHPVHGELGIPVEYAGKAGMENAPAIAAEKLEGFRGDILVLEGTTLLLKDGLLNAWIRRHRETGSAATLIMAAPDPARSGGRAAPRPKKAARDGAVFCIFQSEKVFPILSGVLPGDRRKACDLSDLVRLLTGRNESVACTNIEEGTDVMRVDSLKRLAEARERLQARAIDILFKKGVRIIDPKNVYIEPNVRIGPGTVVHPFSVLRGKTAIGSGCVIGPFVKIDDTKIGNGCRVEFALLERRKIDDGKTIGPFAFWTVENK